MKTKLKTESNQALQAMKVALLFGLFVEEEEEEKRFHSWGAVGPPISANGTTDASQLCVYMLDDR